MSGSVKHVLLVEDNPGDVRLTREVFRAKNERVRLHVAASGAEAVAFLNRSAPHLEAPRPDLILLDLDLPQMDGLTVLGFIKADEALKTIPTLILTASEAATDIAKSYGLNANCYLSKPVELEQLEGLVRSIDDFWLNLPKSPLHGGTR